jgi:hypothetical protein
MNGSLRTRSWLLVLAATWILAPVAFAQETLLPVDEAGMQPEFSSFRARLMAAIEARDASAVLAIVHPGIRNSFGGDEGIEHFKATWKLESSNSPLWNELGAVLRLGGTFDPEGRFIAPYVFSCWPANVHPFENVALVGTNVRVRQGPGSHRATIGSLSYAVLTKAAEKAEHEGWIAVRLPDGKEGYVSSRYARGPVDFRAVFERIDNRWQLISFLAGD